MSPYIRLIPGIILALAILAPPSAPADDEPFKPEPPVRLKKKKKAEPVEEAPPEKKAPDAKNPDDAKVGDKKKDEKKSGESKKLRPPDEKEEPAGPAEAEDDAKET